jgi:peptide/nickel transport system substrate-binding protein
MEETTMAEGRRGKHGPIRVGVSVGAIGLLLGVGFTVSAQARTERAPAYGGAYTVRLPDAPDCLDPQKTATSASYTIDSYVFDSLLSLDKKGHYVGNLATTYKVSSHGTRIKFSLRHGVKFSNGDPFTAAAVKYTFDRAEEPSIKSPVTAGFLSQINETKVLDAYTVELVLKSPFRPLLTNLARAETGIMDPKATSAQGANTCTAPIGTGPYRIQNVGPAFSTVTVVANQLHNFGPSWVHNKGKPYVTRVTFKTIQSDATAASLLVTGGLDIMGVPGSQLSRVQNNKAFVLHRSKSQSLIFIEFNTAHAPFDNVQVRRAVAQLVDRAAMIKVALNGLAQPVYGPVAPTLPFYNKAAGKQLPGFDVSAAAKVIAANHATGPYTFLVPAIPTYTALAQLLQGDAAQAGMKLNIVAKPLGDYISEAAKGNFDVLTLDYSYSDPDVLFFLLDSGEGKGGGLSWSNYSNPTLNGLLEQGRTTLNSKKAAQIYTQAQELINQEAVFLGVADPISIVAVRSSLKGYHLNRAGAMAIQDVYVTQK